MDSCVSAMGSATALCRTSAATVLMSSVSAFSSCKGANSIASTCSLSSLLGNLDLFLETQGIVDAMRLFAQCNIRKCNGLQHPYSFFVGK